MYSPSEEDSHTFVTWCSAARKVWMDTHDKKKEAKRKNWIVSSAPLAPVFDPQAMEFMAVNKKKAGWYAAFIQFKKPQYRIVVIDLFPGAGYVESTPSGVNMARKTVFGTLAENDGPTVSHGSPVHRGIPPNETYEQAEARRQRQDMICRKRKAQSQENRLGEFYKHLPVKYRKK